MTYSYKVLNGSVHQSYMIQPRQIFWILKVIILSTLVAAMVDFMVPWRGHTIKKLTAPFTNESYCLTFFLIFASFFIYIFYIWDMSKNDGNCCA